MQAVNILTKQGKRIELRIYGRSTPYLDGVLDQVKSLGMEDSVLYFGPKSLEDIAIAIDGCDIGVIPNRSSSFIEINMPTRIFEYLSRGKPVVVPRTPGILDYFHENEMIYFEPDNVGNLAEKLRQVIESPEALNETIKSGQAVYLKHRWTFECRNFLSSLNTLLGGSAVKSAPSMETSNP